MNLLMLASIKNTSKVILCVIVQNKNTLQVILIIRVWRNGEVLDVSLHGVVDTL